MNDSDIVVKSTILNGNPHVNGTRITVFNIVMDCQYYGVAELLNFYTDPSLSKQQVLGALRYCQARQCDLDGGHCGGCSLRNKQDGIQSQEDFINLFKELRFTECDHVIKGEGEGIYYMQGQLEDLEQNWKGEDCWVIANELLENIEVED